jgi:hypothetical protein
LTTTFDRPTYAQGDEVRFPVPFPIGDSDPESDPEEPIASVPQRGTVRTHVPPVVLIRPAQPINDPQGAPITMFVRHEDDVSELKSNAPQL